MENQVKELIAEEFGVEVTEINNDTRLIEDLGGESLTIIALISDIEDAFDIDIDHSDFEKINTFGDIIQVLGEKLKAQ